MSKDNVTRRISIFVNGKEVENSLKGVDGQIVHVRNSLRRLVEGTEDYDKKKAELTETLGKLQQRQSEYREELGLTKKAIEVNENSLQGYQNQLREVQNQMNLLDTTSEDFVKNLNELKKKEEELSQKIKDTTTAIKGQEVVFKASENSLQGVEESLKDVTKQMSLLDLSTKEGKEELQKLKITEAELIEKQKQFKSEISQTNVEMQEANEISGGLRGTLTGIWDSLVSGDLQGAKEGISAITSGIGGMIKASLTFIATPIGAALAGLVALAAGAKALFDFNKGLNDMNTELRSLGVNASEISKVRDEISATAETFDKDFKEIAEKANSLSKTYGISMSEANQIIAEGLASGGAQNEEFLDSLGEYDEFFAKAGYSAKEFSDIINTGYDLGIYSDKLPDALKEADLALKENTKSTRDALVNAFGASFSDEVLNKVKTGELTTKQALEAIAQKAQESNLSQQQYAQLTADVFKGAGEDAGGAQKIFEALGQSAKRELDATAKASLQLVDANERLNKAQAELFEIDGFGDMWTKIKVVAVDAFASLLQYIADIKRDAQPLIDLIAIVFVAAWENLKFTVGTVFDIITGVVKSFFAYFSGVVQFWKKLLSGDLKGAFIALADGIGNAFKHIGNIFINLYNNAIKLIQGIVDAASPLLETLGIDVDKLQKKLESFKSKKFEIKGEVTTTTKENKTTTNQAFGAGGGGATADALAVEAKARADAAAKRKAEDEKSAQEEKDRLLEFAKAKEAVAKAELDLYIANNRSKIENGKELTLELVNQEAERLREIEQKKLDAALVEREKQIADAQKKFEEDKINLETLNLLKYEADLEYETARTNLSLQTEEQILANKKALEEQEKALKAEQLILDYELEVAEADTKYQADLLRKQQAYDAEVKLLEAKKNKGIISEDEYKRFVIAAQSEISAFKRQQALSDLQTSLGAMNSLAGALGELFGQSKELAIVQAGINGALSVTSILSAASMGNPILDAVVKGVQIAAAVATTIAQVSKIKSAKAPKKINLKAEKGFFYGGNTGTNPTLGFDNHGPITGYVHKNEYVIPEVMTQDPRFANTIGWLEANRQQKLRGYVEGGPTSSGVSSSNGSSASPEQDYTMMLFSAVSNLNSILSAGIKANVFLGYDHIEKIEEMKTEINQSKQNGIAG